MGCNVHTYQHTEGIFSFTFKLGPAKTDFLDINVMGDL